MDDVHGVPHPTPGSTPPQIQGRSTQAKFILRMTRKRREIAFRFGEETSLCIHKNGDRHLYQVNSRRAQRAIAVTTTMRPHLADGLS